MYVFTFAALLQIWYCQKLHTFWGKLCFAKNLDGVKKMTFCMSVGVMSNLLWYFRFLDVLTQKVSKGVILTVADPWLTTGDWGVMTGNTGCIPLFCTLPYCSMEHFPFFSCHYWHHEELTFVTFFFSLTELARRPFQSIICDVR